MNASFSRVLLCLVILAVAKAQSVGFTVFPQQVVTGLTYTVAWNSNGQSATIELLRNGKKEDTLFSSDGTTNSFQWTVQDDYSGGTNYVLQISSGGSTTSTNNIDVIEDEDGLVISGSTITAPSATSTVDLASITALSSSASAATTTGSSIATSASSSASSGTSSLPSSTSSSSPSPSHSSRITVAGGLSGAVIAGIVVGLLGAAAVGAAGVWLCLRKRRLASGNTGDDDIGSFLALSRKGRASGTIKGTSPEVSDFPHDTHELNAGGIVGHPELYGEHFTPWNARNKQRFYSETRPVVEVNRKPLTTRYELPVDNS